MTTENMSYQANPDCAVRGMDLLRRKAGWVLVAVLAVAGLEYAAKHDMIPQLPSGSTPTASTTLAPGKSQRAEAAAGVVPINAGVSNMAGFSCGQNALMPDAVKAARNQFVSSAQSLILDTGLAPSLTGSFGCGNQLLGTVALGTTDDKKRNKNNTPSAETTDYDISSVTKHITALTIGAMVQKGQISLDDKVGQYIPEWDKGDKRDVTIRMLLSHTSGLQDPESYDPVLGSSTAGTEQKERDYPLTNKPGKYYSYSNLGMDIAAQAASRAAGKPFPEISQELLYDPMDMTRAGWGGHLPYQSKKNFAPTSPDDDKSKVVWFTSQDRLAAAQDGISGHAGVELPSYDLAKLEVMELNGGVYDKKRIVSSKFIGLLNDASTAKQLSDPHKRSTYGLGSSNNNDGFYGTDFSRSAYGHTGWNQTVIVIDPRSGVWYNLVSNGTYKRKAPEDKARVNPSYPAYRAIGNGLVTTLTEQ